MILSYQAVLSIFHIFISKSFNTNFQRYSSRNKYFDTLVVLSKKELPIWQSYQNVKVIPNFLPNIPCKNTDYDKKIVLSVGAD